MLAPDERSARAAAASRSTDMALLLLLSVVAGLVDVTGFLSLGNVFTAHITGNLVLVAAHVANGGSPPAAQLMSIPVFAAAVALAYLLAHRVSPALSARALLLVQSLLLFLVLVLVLRGPRGVRAPAEVFVPAMVAVTAMAFQNAFMRVAVHEGATTVMTGNLAGSVIAALAVVWSGPWTRPEATETLRRTLPLVIGFFGGCVLGAASLAQFGPWTWSLPAVLSLVAIARHR